MAFSHDTGVFNVKATLAAWMTAQLKLNRPPLLAVTRVLYWDPDQPIADNLPCWSITFLDIDRDPSSWTGGVMGSSQVGHLLHGIMQVDVWVTRKDSNWRAQRNQMEDAVRVAATSVKRSGVLVRDFYTNAQTPAELAYRIGVCDAETRETAQDPNPDIERVRMLIKFMWVERVSV